MNVNSGSFVTREEKRDYKNVEILNTKHRFIHKSERENSVNGPIFLSVLNIARLAYI